MHMLYMPHMLYKLDMLYMLHLLHLLYMLQMLHMLYMQHMLFRRVAFWFPPNSLTTRSKTMFWRLRRSDVKPL